MEDIDSRVRGIRRDRQHGATFLTVHAIGVLSDAASTHPPNAEWEGYVGNVTAGLAAAKPAMAGLRNATARLTRRLVRLGSVEGRRQAHRLAQNLLDEIRSSARAAAANAAHLLAPNATLATCSYSSAVLRTCGRARDEGTALTALVWEPTAGPDAPGRRMVERLSGLGVAAEPVGDSDPEALIGRAGLALVGADAVTPESVVNGAPSLSLASAARGRIPFYVVCETVKFAREAHVEDGYDRIPMALVTGIASERGVLEPYDLEGLVTEG